ncbi:unnamed protein product [Diatraea saccharalis]|uniref:C-type lectin domain-containing protein n=1 Tax=Diatraea saccharalis TaxID=40085 RepID=A0A9N9WBL7_9NEOP|nr:unnamed protein product [Diatraea saccharalis]
MRFANIFFLTVSWMTLADCKQYRFDYEYKKEAGGWLKYHPVPATFTDAFLRCHAEGSVVASPLNENLQRAMVDLFKGRSDTCGIFTGIHATLSKGDFSSIEGVPLSNIPIEWAPNEPDNYGNNEDCIIMVNNGTLADVRCNDTFPYICYNKKTAGPVLSPCGTMDPEGGHLAIINSAVEVQVIKDLFSKYPSGKIISRFKDLASIGYYDWGEHGVWYTVHGQSLVEAGYSTFSSGQPDNNTNYDNGSFCGGVYRTGLLDDVWCSGALMPFICEKESSSL